MWKVVMVLVIGFIFYPLTVSGDILFDVYRCVCNYQEKLENGSCYGSDKLVLKVEIDDSWELGKDEGEFSKLNQCENLLDSAVNSGFICSFNCHVEVYTNSLEWVPKYDLKWDTALSTEANPIKVKEGESKTVEVQASANSAVKISCLNCNPPEGTSVKDLGGGKANVIFDTSKKDWLTGKVELKIQASVSGAPNAAPLLGSVWFDVEGVATVQTKEDVDAWISGQYGAPEGYVERGGAIPPCAFSGTCRNINNLLELIINFASGMFAIIGSFAFAFFVYGGFKMIVSMGSPEKVKSGKDAMIAAVIGMVIAFSAYAAINLLLTTLGVEPDSGFREIK